VIVNAKQTQCDDARDELGRLSNVFRRHCKKLDEIRTFSNDRMTLSAPDTIQIARMHIRICIGAACSLDIFTGKNFFHNLLRKMLRNDRNRSKMSESVLTDSRRARPTAGKFSVDACASSSRVEILR
jgi:hypothetical protein